MDEVYVYCGVFGCYIVFILRCLCCLLYYCMFLFLLISFKMYFYYVSVDKLKVDNGLLFVVYGVEFNFIVCSVIVVNLCEYVMVFLLFIFFFLVKCV